MLFYSLLLWLSVLGGSSQAPATAPALASTHTLSGQLTNLRTSRGSCYLALFASADGFPGQAGRALRTLRVPVSGPSCAFSFANLPPGTYALAVYHDENGNNRLDTNVVRFPTERYGFSNNARGRFGPPSFAAAQFRVPGPALTIRLH